MVYFFHHYELPAILQQARIQHLLAHGGGAGGSHASNGTANQDATVQNDTGTTPPGSSTTNQDGQPAVIQNGQIPSQNQNTVEVDDDSAFPGEDFIDLPNLPTGDNREGQQVLGDIELSALLHQTINQTIDVAQSDVLEPLMVQTNQDTDTEVLTYVTDIRNINRLEIANESPQQINSNLEIPSQSTALETENGGAVSSCDTQSSSLDTVSCDSENTVLDPAGINVNSDSAIFKDSLSNSVSENNMLRFRGHSEQNSSEYNGVVSNENENIGTEV